MSSSLSMPRGMETINPSPEISRYYNKANAPYTNTAQVLSEVLSVVRYVGQTFLVVDEEWWFKNGKLNTDLVLKQDSGTGITDLDYTPSPTQGTVTSSTGTDAIISLADNTNAGLMSPSDKDTLDDNVIYRSGTKVGKPVTGDIEIENSVKLQNLNTDEEKSVFSFANESYLSGNTFKGISVLEENESAPTTERIIGIRNYSGVPYISYIKAEFGQIFVSELAVSNDRILISGKQDEENNPDFKGIVGSNFFDKEEDLNAFAQLGDLTPLENNIFDLQMANTGDETTASIQIKRPLKTVNGSSLEGTGNIVVGGAVDSVNGQTGVVLLDADDIDETATRVYVTPTEKTAITHSNRSILDNITEAFTTGLKTSYDSAVTWISTNGTNLLNHLLRTDNPHSVTKTQVGLGSADDTSDVNKPISTATQSALDLKQTTRIIVTSNITAVNGSVYHNNGNNTFTDPTPENNKGFYILNVSGSPTIGGNIFSVGTYLFRYFDGTFWITNVIKDNRFSIKLTITGNITTSTNDASGYGQDGRNIILDNGATALNLTINSAVTSTYLKTGSGAITFVQGAGRTLVLGNATALMNGIAGSTARIISDGTIDYLIINNV